MYENVFTRHSLYRQKMRPAKANYMTAKLQAVLVFYFANIPAETELLQNHFSLLIWGLYVGLIHEKNKIS